MELKKQLIGILNKMKKILPNDYNFILPYSPESLFRLGTNKDGGYVIDKKIVDRTNILVSFGMGDEYSFEDDFLKKDMNNKVFIFDYSVSHIFYIKEIMKNIRRILKFKKRYKELKDVLKSYSNFKKFINRERVYFFPKKITRDVINKEDINISKVFEEFKLNPEQEITLKIDIEGSEYDIIDDILSYEKHIGQIVMEYHDIHKNKNIFFDHMRKFQKFFNIIHLHGNNYRELNDDGFPINIEVTFCKKKYIGVSCKKSYTFPIEKLDYPNNPKLPDLQIEFQKN